MKSKRTLNVTDFILIKYCVGHEIEKTESSIIFSGSMEKAAKSKNIEASKGWGKRKRSQTRHLKELNKLIKILEESSQIEVTGK